MKYTAEITINLPRKEVIRLFDNRKNLFEWQESLKSIDHIEGEPGEEGATSRLVYSSRKSDLVLTEMINKRNLPEEFITTYKTKGINNKVINYFNESGNEQTSWSVVSLFRFKGLMILMAPFMKSAFASNTRLNMERFKAFAEQQRTAENRTI